MTDQANRSATFDQRSELGSPLNRPRRVLLADDERIGRQLLQSWLEAWGYSVTIAVDGNQAMEALRRDPELRLAVLDWVMPGMDGLEVCREIRKGASEPYVYVMLLTARDDQDHIVQGLEAGADDYLTKPCNPLELRVRLRAGERVVALQSELITAREKLRYEAMHDPLTGLLNRRATMTLLEQEYARVQRTKSSMAVVMVDLDHFKAINDTHGHAGGDIVLKQAAARLRCTVRAYDSVGRLGGEEFLILLPSCGHRDALAIAERLRRIIGASPISGGSKRLRISASFGVAASESEPSATAEELVEAADAALYRAKRGGRNRVEAAIAEDWQAVKRAIRSGAPASSG